MTRNLRNKRKIKTANAKKKLKAKVDLLHKRRASIRKARRLYQTLLLPLTDAQHGLSAHEFDLQVDTMQFKLRKMARSHKHTNGFDQLSLGHVLSLLGKWKKKGNKDSYNGEAKEVLCFIRRLERMNQDLENELEGCPKRSIFSSTKK